MTDDELIAAALAARAGAYAPYSEYQVGAAVAAGDQVFTGANVENASYGLSICAERNACCRAANAGARDLDRIAIATISSPPAEPCGMCLQTLREFTRAPAALRIILVNPAGERRAFTLAEMLPHGFGPDSLD